MDIGKLKNKVEADCNIVRHLFSMKEVCYEKNGKLVTSSVAELLKGMLYDMDNTYRSIPDCIGVTVFEGFFDKIRHTDPCIIESIVKPHTLQIRLNTYLGGFDISTFSPEELIDGFLNDECKYDNFIEKLYIHDILVKVVTSYNIDVYKSHFPLQVFFDAILGVDNDC
jgi:hypothetical protein